MTVLSLQQGWSGKAGVQFYADTGLTAILATSFTQEINGSVLDSTAMWGLMDTTSETQTPATVGRYKGPFIYDVPSRDISFSCEPSKDFLEKLLTHIKSHRHMPVKIVFESREGSDRTTCIFPEIYLKGATITCSLDSLVELSMDFMIPDENVWSFSDDMSDTALVGKPSSNVIAYYDLGLTYGKLGWSMIFQQNIEPMSFCRGSREEGVPNPHDLLFSSPEITINTTDLIRKGLSGYSLDDSGTQAKTSSSGSTIRCLYQNTVELFSCTGCFVTSDSADIINMEKFTRERSWTVYGEIK